MVQSFYMNDMNTHKAALEEEKIRLEAELGTVGRQNPSNPKDWEPAAIDEAEADPNLKADHMDHFGENVAILESLEILYKDVSDALARIDAGTYGTCEVGGEEIEGDRLSADPAARTCKVHMNA